MGWNNVTLRHEHPLFAGLQPENRDFYFVHSFHVRCRDDADVLATAPHGGEFTACIARANVVGLQFHPEKSQDNGLQILTNFARWTPAGVLSPAAAA
jgi:glutamine amidotransferase